MNSPNEPVTSLEQFGKRLTEGKDPLLTEAQLQEALNHAAKTGHSFRDVLVEDKKWVGPETFVTLLSLHTRVPIVDLQQVQIEQAALDLVPENVARSYKVLPLAVDPEDGSIRVAMDNPLDQEALAVLARVTRLSVKPRLPLRGGITEMLNRYYKVTPKVTQELRERLGQALEVTPAELLEMTRGTTPEFPPTEEMVGRALDMIISQARKDRASDIQVEPAEDSLIINFRINGILREAARLPEAVKTTLVPMILERIAGWKIVFSAPTSYGDTEDTAPPH